MRTSSKRVTFARPFRLGGVVGEQPAGSYRVDTGEAQGGAVAFAAHQRVPTWLRLPLPWGAAGSSQTIIIDPAELELALARDAAPERYGPETITEHEARRRLRS